MADSVHIRSFCAQASRQGCFGRLRAADVNAATIRRAYVCVSRLAAGWSLTLAVLAAQIRSSLAPPSGSCSACGDLLVDDATVAGIAFRWGFTNLGRFARDYQDLFGETPSMTRRQPTL
jgi:AraC-like DNA-binding protein